MANPFYNGKSSGIYYRFNDNLFWRILGGRQYYMAVLVSVFGLIIEKISIQSRQMYKLFSDYGFFHCLVKFRPFINKLVAFLNIVALFNI